jgi:hypothetical protein
MSDWDSWDSWTAQNKKEYISTDSLHEESPLGFRGDFSLTPDT